MTCRWANIRFELQVKFWQLITICRESVLHPFEQFGVAHLGKCKFELVGGNVFRNHEDSTHGAKARWRFESSEDLVHVGVVQRVADDDMTSFVIEMEGLMDAIGDVWRP